MSNSIPPIGGGRDAIPPVQPSPKSGDTPSKPKDKDFGPGPQKKQRVNVLDDGTIELHPDDGGEVVKTTLDKLRDEYRRMFGEEPPNGSVIDIRA